MRAHELITPTTLPSGVGAGAIATAPDPARDESLPFVTRLLGRRLVAEDTLAFELARPPGYTYQAGQSARVRLLVPPHSDAAGDTRELTLASAPCADTLLFVVRLRPTGFKQSLPALPLGAAIALDEADGDLVLHEDGSRAAVFVAGGVGITPFLSMVHQALHDALPHAMHLFYANRRPETAAFLPDLQALQRQHANFHLIATMTAPETSARPWRGERGHIGPQLLARHLPDARHPVYYLAGPPALTLDVLDVLEDMGVEGGSVKSVEFDGY